MGASRMSFGALRRTAVRQNAVLDWAANTYANMLGGQLRKYGLRVEDIYTETPEIMEAVKRLSPQEKEERSMRLRRAVDLSFKRTYLPADMQASHEPFKMYLHPNIVQVEKRWRKRRPSSASTGQC